VNGNEDLIISESYSGFFFQPHKKKLISV